MSKIVFVLSLLVNIAVAQIDYKMFEGFLSKDEVKIKIKELQGYERLSNRKQEELSYYNYLLATYNEWQDFAFYKENVNRERSEILSKIKRFNKKDIPDIVSLGKFEYYMQRLRKAKSLLYEKRVVYAKLKYELKRNSLKLAGVKREIIKLRALKGRLKSSMIGNTNRSAMLKKIKDINSILNLKKRLVRLIDINKKVLSNKIEVSKIDIDTYKRLVKYENRILEYARENLLIGDDEIEIKKQEIEQKQKIAYKDIELLEKQIYSLVMKLDTLREKRASLYRRLEKVGKGKEPLLIKRDIMLIDYQINYYKANIEFIKDKMHLKQTEIELDKIRFKYLLAISRYHENKDSSLYLKEYNILMEKYNSFLKMKRLALMEGERLLASINTMKEMIRESELEITEGRDKDFNSKKINHLKGEIALKLRYIRFLEDYRTVLERVISMYKDTLDFYGSRMGIKRIFIKGRTKPGVRDIYIALVLAVFLFIWLKNRSEIIGAHKHRFMRIISRYLHIWLPLLIGCMFVVGISGYDALYRFVVWGVLESLAIVYISIVLINRIKAKMQSREETKEGEKSKFSVMFYMVLSVAKILIVVVDFILLFVIWVAPLNLIGIIFKSLNIDYKELEQLLITKSLKLILIFGVGAFIIYLSNIIGKKIFNMVEDDNRLEVSEREARAKTLINVAQNIIRIVVFLIVLFSFLQEMGINIAPLLTGAGIVGLAIGFGAQSLVKDFFSGFFILMENQFAVGDVVSIGGQAGLVEKITLRTTVLRDLSGVVHIIPNGNISSVSNMTHGYSRAVLDVSVAYKEDVDRVIEVLNRIGEEMYNDPKWRDLFIDKPAVLGVDKLADSGVIIKLLAATKPIKQWDVMRELNRRIKNTFDKEGIEIPFPHLKVVMDK